MDQDFSKRSLYLSVKITYSMFGNINEKDKAFIIDFVETVITSFVVLAILYLGIAFPEVVQGASMEPTLYTNERILVERVSKHFKGFQRGDVVVLHPPGDDSVDYVKRIVGLPGDVVRIQDCHVYISSSGEKFQLEENYLSNGVCTLGGPILKDGRAQRLGSDEYVVLGDNRENSADSRFFGPVSKGRILGKVVFRFWPINVAGFF